VEFVARQCHEKSPNLQPLRKLALGSFHVKQAKIQQKCRPESGISKLIFFVGSYLFKTIKNGKFGKKS
jgi:hypothetical protein